MGFLDGDFHIHHGDTIPHMHDLPEACMDFLVTSVPFPSVYAYTSLGEDIGNSEDLQGEAKIHFSYFFRAARRIMKPGRVVMIHCMDIVRLKRSGEDGLYPFADLLRRIGMRAGFSYEYTWTIRKNPQAQAIRNKAWELKFQGIETDRANSRGALPDYVIKFQVPGENKVPVLSKGDVSRNDWIDWAECTWSDIKETSTLNKSEGRGEQDTKHICPLQLPLLNRLIRLYTNPGEVVFDPFSGIGSTGYEALKLGRRYYGSEIKNEYHAASLVNMERALKIREENHKTLFDMAV